MNMPATPATAGFTRALIRRRLCNWGCRTLIDDALVVAAELLSNAIKATPGKPITVHCRCEDGGVYVAVWDSSPERPAPVPLVEPHLDDLDGPDACLDIDGGRGLHIVGALADEWGYRPDPPDPAAGHAPGKWVWARLTT